jgi:nucleotide-binding universal stress UspA family protein
MDYFKKILAAVDGSEASLHALSETIRLSYWVKGRVCAIYAAPPYEGDLRFVGVRNLDALFREPCEKTLHKIKETAETCGAGIEAFCVTGQAHEKILEFSETQGCDLIVMGIKPKHPLCRAWALGTAEKVICRTDKDVLLIPGHAFIGWDKIIALSGLSGGCGNAEIRGRNLAAAYGGEFLRATFSSKKLTDIAEMQDAGLIILEQCRASQKIKNFFRNTVKKLIYVSPCPVLIVKN